MRKVILKMKVTHIGKENLKETEQDPVVSWRHLVPNELMRVDC